MTEHKDMLERLLASRVRAVNEQRALLEEISKRDDQTPSGEEREKLARMDADIVELKQQIDDRLSLQKRETENAELRAEIEHIVRPQIVDRREDTELEQIRSVFSRGGSMEINIAAAANARNAIRAGARGTEFRDLLAGNAATGASLVPTAFATQLYDFLEVFSGVRRTNVTVITTASGESMDFPKVTLHGTAAIVGEGTALAENDPQFGKLSIPTYKYGQLLQISNELLTDSAVDVRGFIAKDMGRALGRVTDSDYLKGSGSNAPQGALVAMGTATTIQTSSTGVPSYSNLVTAKFSVNEEYRANGAQWLMRDAFVAELVRLADTTGRPLFQPSMQLGQPDTLLGHVVVTDPNMGAVGTAASTPIAFGDWSAFYIRDVAGVRLDVSPDFAFDKDLITYRAILRTGSGLIDLTGALKKVLEPTT